MNSDLVIRNARIVLAEEVVHGSLLARDGRIVDLHTGPSAVGEDLDGDLLMPGVVELHTDHLETHFRPRPGRFWDAVPAVVAHDAQLAAAGATTVLDAIRIGSGAPDDVMGAHAPGLVAAVGHAAEAGMLRADHHIHLRCEVSTPDVVDAFDALGDDARIRLVSLMDHTPGQRQYVDLDALREHLAGRRAMNEEQIEAHIAQRIETGAAWADRHRRLMAERAAARGIVIAAHDDATEAHVRESAELGVAISEFPTTLEAARAARAAGQRIVMGAPNIVRGGSHSGNIAARDLLVAGLLDILSSDYVPASPLQAIIRLAEEGVITLPEGAALVAANPAAAVGLEDRGVIEQGRRADLIRVRAYEAPQRRVPVVRGVWREGRRVA